MSHKTKMEEEKVGGRIDWERVNASLPSVTNSSDGLIFVKIRALDGRKDGQNLNFYKNTEKDFKIFKFHFGMSKISLLATLVSEGTIYMKILRKIIYWLATRFYCPT